MTVRSARRASAIHFSFLFSFFRKYRSGRRRASGEYAEAFVTPDVHAREEEKREAGRREATSSRSLSRSGTRWGETGVRTGEGRERAEPRYRRGCESTWAHTIGSQNRAESEYCVYPYARLCGANNLVLLHLLHVRAKLFANYQPGLTLAAHRALPLLCRALRAGFQYRSC